MRKFKMKLCLIIKCKIKCDKTSPKRNYGQKRVIFAEVAELQLNDLFNIFKAPATFYPIIFNSYN